MDEERAGSPEKESEDKKKTKFQRSEFCVHPRFVPKYMLTRQ